MTPILILGSLEPLLHHGTLGIARSAGKLGVPVFAGHPGRRTRGCPSRYCRGQVRLPADMNREAALACLRAFADRHGPSVLVAVDDASAIFIADNADALAGASFLFPRQPPGLVRRLASKREMHEICREHGIPNPQALFPCDVEEVRAAAGTMTFPVVAKRIDASQPTRAQSGAGAPADPSTQPPSVLIAADRAELLAAYEAMESPLQPNVMVQEYVPGGRDWMFNGYFDADCECRVGFTGRKHRQSPPYTGATTLGVCASNATVERHSVRLAKAVGYRGTVDVDCRFDVRDGQFKLLDFNPRIGSAFRLFVSRNGVDVLRSMYLDLTGQPVPAADVQEGRRWLTAPLDVRSSLIYLRNGDITLGEWARSLRHVQETAWFSWDDPGPAAAMLAVLLVDRARRARTRRRAARVGASVRGVAPAGRQSPVGGG